MRYRLSSPKRLYARFFSNKLYLLGWAGLLCVVVYFSYQGYMLMHHTDNTNTGSHGARWRVLPQTSSTNVTKDETTPPPVAVAVEPPKPATNAEDYGIAAGGGLIYVGQEELDVYFGQLRDLGVKWVRWDIDWGFIQPDGPADFRWGQIDLVANTAQKFGIKSLGIITYTPAWARKSACSDSDACAPANPAAFGVFAGQVAARYKGRITTYEVWNEPNYTPFWLPKPNIDEYKAVLDASYTQIKAADSGATVLAGGLAAVGDEDGDITPLTFVQGLYARGAQNSFNAVAIHPYSYPAPPSHVAWWNRWQQIGSIRNQMVAAGDGNKQIWITEYGAPTGGAGKAHTTAMGQEYIYENDYMTEAAQNDLMTDSLKLYQGYGSWAGPFFWYSLKDNGTSKGTPENFFGLLRYDGSKKPAYSTFQSAIK